MWIIISLYIIFEFANQYGNCNEPYAKYKDCTNEHDTVPSLLLLVVLGPPPAMMMNFIIFIVVCQHSVCVLFKIRLLVELRHQCQAN